MKLFSTAFAICWAFSSLFGGEIERDEVNDQEKFPIENPTEAHHLGYLTRCNKCQLGRAGFSTMDPSNWYTIETFSYPTTTLLSAKRNHGFTQGDVELTANGLLINKPGNYFISFSTVMTNTTVDNQLIPVFVIKNNVFDPNDSSGLGTVVSLIPDVVSSAGGSGILENLEAGTTLSIVATNGGGDPQPKTVTIVAWGIDAFRIPCKPD